MEKEDAMSVFRARFLLTSYPKNAKVGQYCQSSDSDDNAFMDAVRVILGDDAEYSAFCEKDVRWLIGRASSRIQEMLR